MFLSILILAPLAGFLINSFFSFKIHRAAAAGVSCSLASFSAAVGLFMNSGGSSFRVSFFPWIEAGALQSSFGFIVDPLSLTMVLIITGVGFLIHVFSAGYMAQDACPARYFSYLNLFLFNMLILVLADNLLLLFAGWEGVGLCSYLLIGFWFKDRKKSLAGLKAFLINRVGDAGFLIGIFLFFSLFGTLDFSVLDRQSDVNSSFLATLTCLFFLVGAVGKSAQIPLYTWLPSAMAGPTPVSALIHAATMVTAGVYLIIRTKAIWTASPFALEVTAVIGVLTLLIGAWSACKAWDIKKVLAYSTISQLGYMFLALGIGAFSSALFHLMTHAFFKACLFLSAGSLIHGLSGEQDIRNMGQSVRKKMPITFASFLIGAAALMGLAPLSGFFSKDEILYSAFHDGHYILWILGLAGAGLTSFYTAKTLYFVFWKQSSKDHPAHEGGWIMKGPLIGLSFLSIFAGLINWPAFLPKAVSYYTFKKWLNLSALKPASSEDLIFEALLAGGSVLFILAVFFISIHFLRREKTVLFFSWLFKPNWSLDNFYKTYITQKTLRLSSVLFQYFEEGVIHNAIVSVGRYFVVLRKAFISFQTGALQHYIFFIGLGFLFFILSVIFFR